MIVNRDCVCRYICCLICSSINRRCGFRTPRSETRIVVVLELRTRVLAITRALLSASLVDLRSLGSAHEEQVRSQHRVQVGLTAIKDGRWPKDRERNGNR